jgi:hypothetical protein
MEQKAMEREIDGRELLWNALCRWRTAVTTAALAMAGAAGIWAVKGLLQRNFSLSATLVMAFSGALLGLLGTFVWEFMRFGLSRKLYSSDEIQKRYHCPVLAASTLRHPGGKTFLDQWMIKKQRKGGAMSAKKAREIGAAKAANLTQPGQRILITGTVHEKQIDSVAKALLQRMPERAVEIVPRLHRDPEAIAQLATYDKVILVEAKGITLCDELEELLDLLSLYNKDILGCIVL